MTTSNAVDTNTPPRTPADGSRGLPLVNILHLSDLGGSKIINYDTLLAGNGLAVQLPTLPPFFKDQTITFLFYMNGYFDGTSQTKTAGPPDPNYMITTTVSSLEPTQVTLPLAYAIGFGESNIGHMSVSYVDYFIGSTPGSYIYGPYGTANALTDTAIPNT